MGTLSQVGNMRRWTKCTDNSKANLECCLLAPSVFLPLRRSDSWLLPDLCLQPTKSISQRHWQLLHHPEFCPPAMAARYLLFQKCGYFQKQTCCSLYMISFPNITTQLEFPFFIFIAVSSASFDSSFIKACVTPSDICLEILHMWLRSKEVSKCEHSCIIPLVYYPLFSKSGAPLPRC